MKLDERIRGAVNSRLSFLDADTGRRARIRARIRKEEEPEMKRKVSAGMALTALMIVLTAGVALAAGLNLFDYFSNEDVRFADMASQAELSATETVMVHSKALGATAASITNAYYDGRSLLVAYSIENGTRREPFVPTAQQLAEMTRMESPMPVMIENGADTLARQYNDALKSGTPFGYITYAVTPSDHTLTDSGADLGPATETGGEQENGAVYAIREFDTAPPEAEYINLEIPLWQSIQYLYFDGTNSYTLAAREDAGSMTATVWRTDVTRLHLTGSGWYLDSAVTAEADVSAEHAELVFTVDGDGFIPPDADSWRGVALSDTLDSSALHLEGEIWYDAILNDANGNRLTIESVELTDSHTITASFQGTGGLTGSMTGILLICGEDAATNVTSAITLRVEPGTAGTAAYIMNTHYDDESLSVAYTIQNRTWREPFTPTEEQLAEMIRLEDGTLPLPELNDPLALRYGDAVQSGTPFGVITYTVFADDRVMAGTVPGTAVDLGPADKTRSEETNTAQTVIREYVTPQIAGEYLNLEIPLWTNIVYRYFDGTDSYGMNAACETAGGAIKTTVWREKPETLYISGTGWYLDAPVSAAAEVSAAQAKIILRADGDGFLNPDADGWREMTARQTDGGDVPAAAGEVWYDVVVLDENGNHLPTESCTLQDAYMISALLKGTGSLPEGLTVTLQMCTDGAAVQAAQPIVLRPEIVEAVNPYTAPADQTPNPAVGD